jgi:hypothetical protein
MKKTTTDTNKNSTLAQFKEGKGNLQHLSNAHLSKIKGGDSPTIAPVIIEDEVETP